MSYSKRDDDVAIDVFEPSEYGAAMPATLLIDVIEDALEFELSEAMQKELLRIPKLKLSRLRDAVKDYEWGLWAHPGQPRQDELVHFIPANSPAGINLGATGQGARYAEQFTFRNKEMNGLLAFILTKYDSIAIETGLGYYLDTTSELREDDPSGRNALRVLRFYSQIAPLLKSEVVRIVPSQHRAKFQTRYFSDVAGLNSFDENVISGLRAEYDQVLGSGEEDAELFVNREQFIAHFLLCGEIGYRPLINGSHWFTAWNRVAELGFSNPSGTDPLALQLHKSSVAIPMFGQVKPVDIVGLRDDDCFVHFRKAVRDIDTYSGENGKSPIEVNTFVDEKLSEAEAAINQRTKSSGFLAKIQDGWIDAAFNVIPSSLVAAQVYPPAQWPVWYSLLTGGITLAGTAGISHAKNIIRKGTSSKHLRLISQVRTR